MYPIHVLVGKISGCVLEPALSNADLLRSTVLLDLCNGPRYLASAMIAACRSIKVFLGSFAGPMVPRHLSPPRHRTSPQQVVEPHLHHVQC